MKKIRKIRILDLWYYQTNHFMVVMYYKCRNQLAIHFNAFRHENDYKDAYLRNSNGWLASDG